MSAVYTDHQALVSSFIPYLKSQTKGILARWYLRLSQYLPNVTLEHKPGSVNRVADALSGVPVPEVLQMEIVEEEPIMDKIRKAQRSDSELNQLIQYLEEKSLPGDSVRARKLLTQAQKGYFLVDGVLYFENGDAAGRRRLVVPASLHKEVLSEHHEAMFAGHFALKKMYRWLSQYYYWPGMRAAVYKVCESCVVCAPTQGQEWWKKPPLKCIPVGKPFEC